MSGPIIAGEKPLQEALFVIAFISFLFVFGSPEIAAKILSKLSWLAPVFHLLHRLLNLN